MGDRKSYPLALGAPRLCVCAVQAARGSPRVDVPLAVVPVVSGLGYILSNSISKTNLHMKSRILRSAWLVS